MFWLPSMLNLGSTDAIFVPSVKRPSSDDVHHECGSERLR